MPYMTQYDLQTHLYAETILEITRDNVKEYATLSGFPDPGISAYKYKATDTGKYYIWDGNGYTEITYVDITAKAIAEGIGQAKSYLNRYDLVAIFGTADDDPTFQDDYLDSLVKDIICWRLIKLSNPNINLELFRTAYEDAVIEFGKVQKGNTYPAWPLRANDENTAIDDAGNVEFSSNVKRINHY
jgi:hypothetical protein